jgi:hypothetical protein
VELLMREAKREREIMEKRFKSFLRLNILDK